MKYTIPILKHIEYNKLENHCHTGTGATASDIGTTYCSLGLDAEYDTETYGCCPGCCNNTRCYGCIFGYIIEFNSECYSGQHLMSPDHIPSCSIGNCASDHPHNL